MSDFKYPISTENGMLRCKERYSLLLEHFKTFLQYVRMVGRESYSTINPLMVHTVSFLPITTLNFHAKYQISGILSAGDKW